MLDAILSPEWDYRYYSYNASWGPGEEMANMRDGSGDEWFILFDPHGAALKGFAHETSADTVDRFVQAMRAQVPDVFSSFLHEVAFDIDHSTFSLWRRNTDSGWSAVTTDKGLWEHADEGDGAAELLALLDGRPGSYQAWAEEYYEHAVDLSVVQAIYAHTPLTAALVQQLNPDLLLEEAQEFAQEIGYPL